MLLFFFLFKEQVFVSLIFSLSYDFYSPLFLTFCLFGVNFVLFVVF